MGHSESSIYLNRLYFPARDNDLLLLFNDILKINNFFPLKVIKKLDIINLNNSNKDSIFYFYDDLLINTFLIEIKKKVYYSMIFFNLINGNYFISSNHNSLYFTSVNYMGQVSFLNFYSYFNFIYL